MGELSTTDWSKLPDNVVAHLKERLIAGDSDDEVRQALKEFGAPKWNLDRVLIWKYRQLPEVKTAIEEMNENARQVGLLNRTRRADWLLGVMRGLYDRLQGVTRDRSGVVTEQGELPTHKDAAMLVAQMRGLSADIEILLEGNPNRPIVQVNQVNNTTVENDPYAAVLRTYNDLLERHLLSLQSQSQPAIPAINEDGEEV